MLFRSIKLLEECWWKMRSAREDLEAIMTKRAGFVRSRKRSQQSRVKAWEWKACKGYPEMGEVMRRKGRKAQPEKHQPEMQGVEKALDSLIRSTRFS